MSMLDRPISEFDGPADSVRVPVVPPTGECKPFQEVLVELGVAPEASRVHDRRRRAQVQGLPRLRRQLRAASRASASSWAGAARTAASTCAASRTRSSGRCTRRTTASSTTALPRDACTTCATGTAATSTSRKDKGWRQKNDADPARALLATRCRRSASPRRARRRAASRRSTCASASTTYFDPLPFWYPPLEDAGDRPRRVSARRDHAAADGDVPLVGFAERVAAPDPQPQLPARAIPRTARARRHRRRRLVLGRERRGARCAAWSATARRSSPARCGPGTRSARPPAPGSSRPAPTSRARASC